ncbi:acyl-CoA mutase large subunit family protein [Anaeromyxobacter diazotrophicus]|uniref:Methylmalonyl-CoA mutase n=1 Tax=Anaeromyxobacter diazotrophicus TaxID=2590199 RepID=A0A7I9VTA8_9BACT|nr:methylmalonyl-CoA mutase family protein [Anaeromyxobacter diazotrophicus]GEJ59541.1 methylmalonyl-CoA mutase [Anaeromyxobacter diazotrophicus]
MTDKRKWLETTFGKAVKKAPERRPAFETTSGIRLDPVYAAGDVREGVDERLGLPGEYPFTRGVQSTMYRGRFWTMRQYAGFGTAEESNKRYRYLLASGQTGLSVAFDLPTQMGRDSDHPRARGEVGKVGVAIDSVRDMATLLDGIPLGQVSTSMTINATGGILLALYQAIGEQQGVAPAELQGTIQNDILKEYAARGTYIYPPEPSIRFITDIFAYTAKVMPKWNPISISGYHIREAGSTAVQEVAFTLADGIAYVEAAVRAGLDVDAFAGRLSFFFNAHNNLLEEVAKFRAARRLWARIMKERFKAKDPRSMMLRFHTQTAGSALTAQQPDNNIVRVTLQALAAVLGGTQSLHTNSRDEALGLPTEASVRVALRTQQIIANESGVADVIDPLGGSWAVEALTDEIEGRAQQYLTRIDEMGGMVQAISKGYVQREIQEAAYAWQRRVEAKEELVVGVNAFKSEDPPVPVLKVDPALEVAQAARVQALRRERDQGAAQAAVDAVRRAARGTDNLMPVIVAAVKAQATLGEISDALRDVFGEYRENVVL